MQTLKQALNARHKLHVEWRANALETYCSCTLHTVGALPSDGCHFNLQL